MKKALSLILALVLCLGLCACSAGANELSPKEKNLIGEWTNSGYDGFILLSSGKAITGTNSFDNAVNSHWLARSGTWEVEGNYLIIYIESDGTENAYIYEIISNNEVNYNQNTYTKK